MKKIRLLFLMILSLFILTSCALGAVSQIVDVKAELIGDAVVTVELGSTYEDTGATIIINGVDYKNDIVVDNKVDTTKEGIYVITYSLIKDNHNIVLTRVVNVEDTSNPLDKLVFNLNGDDVVNVKLNEKYNELGVVCEFDGVDDSAKVKTQYFNGAGLQIPVIDTSALGSYLVKYVYETAEIQMSLSRVVNIVEMEDLSIHFMMLGNEYAGDCIYIKAGETDVLVDAGSRSNSAQAITSYIDSYVTDDKLEYVIATHADQDHIAAFPGANGILSQYQIDTIIDFPITNKTTKVYQNYRAAVDSLVANGTTHYTALECYNNLNGATRIIELAAGIEIEILYNSFYETKSSDENNYSVCFMLRRGETSFLFTGDLEKEGEESLVQNNDLGEVYLYKAGHHGSKTSSSLDLLNIIKPEVVVCTCIAFTTEYTENLDNTFPTKIAVDNFNAVGVKHLYVPAMASDNEQGYEPANGNIVVYSNANGNYVECSHSNDDFFTFEIFKKYREWN